MDAACSKSNNLFTASVSLVKSRLSIMGTIINVTIYLRKVGKSISYRTRSYDSSRLACRKLSITL
jgi:hypothetical protein